MSRKGTPEMRPAVQTVRPQAFKTSRLFPAGENSLREKDMDGPEISKSTRRLRLSLLTYVLAVLAVLIFTLISCRNEPVFSLMYLVLITLPLGLVTFSAVFVLPPGILPYEWFFVMIAMSGFVQAGLLYLCMAHWRRSH